MGALNTYLQQTQRLLQDKIQAQYNLADLTAYVNDARLQIALSTESIRQPAQFDTVIGQQQYPYSGMTFSAAPTVPSGLGAVCNVRSAHVLLSGSPPGQQRMETRAWEWFNTFYLSSAVPPTGQPTIFTRLQPGLNGVLWLAPIPDQVYTIQVDAVATPAALASDGDPEALSSPWTDAVPFYAAYLALLSSNNFQAADEMWQQYQRFEQRGTQLTTPTRLPGQYPGGAGAVGAAAHNTLAPATRR